MYIIATKFYDEINKLKKTNRKELRTSVYNLTQRK